MKIIPMVFPEHQRHIDEMGGDPRSPLARETFAKLGEILAARPEVSAAFAILYTPPPEGHPKGATWDTTHTALTGEGLGPDVLRDMLDQLIPTLIKLRILCDEDPSQIFVEEKRQ